MRSVPMHRLILLMVVSFSIGCDGCELDGEPVTGGPELQDHTDEYEQAEAVVAIKDIGAGQQVITIAYNDLTQDPNDPKVTYPDGSDGETRNIFKGASQMGWSYSTDNGFSYIYGGRVEPPAGWSVIWSDPALTTGPTMITPDGELKLVYRTSIGISDVTFPASGVIDKFAVSFYVDGFCAAMSIDGGLTFSNVRCFKQGICEGGTEESVCDEDSDCGFWCNGDFYDGTALTHLNNTIYFASFNFDKKTHEVWRAPAGTLDFKRMANRPFGSSQMIVWRHRCVGSTEG